MSSSFTRAPEQRSRRDARRRRRLVRVRSCSLIRALLVAAAEEEARQHAEVVRRVQLSVGTRGAADAARVHDAHAHAAQRTNQHKVQRVRRAPFLEWRLRGQDRCVSGDDYDSRWAQCAGVP